MKIVFTGGGTGGHIFPIIAVCRKIKKIFPEKFKVENGEDVSKILKIYYLGPKDAISPALMSQEGIRVKIVSAGKIRRYIGVKPVLQNLIDIFFKIPLGIVSSFFYLFFINPGVIFSKGGYGSFPVVIAGWILGIPIFLHESDAVPGAANKFLSRFAIETFASFPLQRTGIELKSAIFVGNPIRSEILKGLKEKAKTTFNLSGEKPVILILGGSQGAQRLNDVILRILAELLADFEIIHQAGDRNIKQMEAESKVVVDKNLYKDYHLVPFLEEKLLADAYEISDLIISRAGAGSIFEIAAAGKPSILIPLPESAQNHQIKNGYGYAQSGAAMVIEENNLTPYFFLERIKYLFSHPTEMERMKMAAKRFSKPQAAKIIAEYILEYLSQ